MKEHPIIFQDAMVRALLAGTKSQTRRAIKPQPVYAGGAWKCADGSTHQATRPSKSILASCPYGQPGDHLYVREAFSGPRCMDTAPPSKWGRSSRIWYWADGNPESGDWTKPKPSIHMPRWASRILLEVTEVRVQRLWEISEADAIAEGVEAIPYTGPNAGPNRYSVGDSSVGWANFPTAREAYAHLWDQINGAGSWDANPWVWAVAFQGLNASALIAGEDTETGA